MDQLNQANVAMFLFIHWVAGLRKLNLRAGTHITTKWACGSIFLQSNE